MKLTIISGSQRSQSQSLNVAKALKQLAHSQFDDITILDLHQLNLPFWNEGVWNGTEEWQQWASIAEQLSQADAFIFISPEWHGMATPALKNFLLLTTDQEMAHKPVLLVSVSASINGVYPISEMRMTGNKNNHACFLPDHLIFRDIDSLINEKLMITEPHFLARCEYTLQLLFGYTHALAPIHQKFKSLGNTFRYGM